MKMLWREIKDRWFFIACPTIAVATAIGLSACTAAPSSPLEDRAEEVLDRNVYVKEVPMHNGRYVTCIFFDPVGSNNGALSCDWVKYNKEQ